MSEEKQEKAIKVLMPESIDEVHLETPEHVLSFLLFRAIEEQTRVIEKQGKEQFAVIQKMIETIEKNFRKGK